jgi:acetaldehyde dehydrogenase (acetylating)
MPKLRVAVIGSGNIGTDLVVKVRRSQHLELVGLAGIDPESEGLARAASWGVLTTHRGLEDLLEQVDEIDLAFDATSASAHPRHAELLAARGIRSVDLTPAALGPQIVPSVNLGSHMDAPDVNLISCGAQATVPVVAALSSVATVPYAENVSTTASRSVGPGTRQNLDEFTYATARSLEAVGGAARGKAMALMNPADPPVLMRNVVYAKAPGIDLETATSAVTRVVDEVSTYVPGYRLKVPPMVERDVVTVFIEVEGAGDYLPPYAGNLDIMTSAAVRVAEQWAIKATGA